MTIDEKKNFLVVSPSSERLKWFESTIQKHVSKATVFKAPDGLEAVSKLQNFPPHVLITELELPKTPGIKLVELALNAKGSEATAVIIAAHPPKQSHNVDEIVSGKLQYFTTPNDEAEFSHCLVKALNFASHKTGGDFHLRFLAPGDVLLKEGDKGDNVYLVKKGQLKATRKVDGKDVVLGNIEYGEFVGEMSYINGEPRNATVTAISDCELIEVPIGQFDKILHKQPAWSKALMLTLTKRVKAANTGKLESE